MYQEKLNPKKQYNRIMDSKINLQNRINTTFINCENIKTYNLHRPLLNLLDKKDLN